MADEFLTRAFLSDPLGEVDVINKQIGNLSVLIPTPTSVQSAYAYSTYKAWLDDQETRNWEYGISVKGRKFGAKGDGTTDDTTAIQNALNSITSGGTVRIPYSSSNYIVTAALTLPTGVRIESDGATLQMNTVSIALFTASNVNNIMVRGLKMKGMGSGTGQQALNLSNCNDVKVYDCSFDSFTSAYRAVNGARHTIQNNFFSNSFDAAITTDLVDEVICVSNKVDTVGNGGGNSPAGIYLRDGNYCRVSKCYVKDVSNINGISTIGIQVRGNTKTIVGCEIGDCVVTGSSLNGILVQLMQDSSIHDCYCYGINPVITNSTGIRCYANTSGIKVTNCTADYYDTGILCDDASTGSTSTLNAVNNCSANYCTTAMRIKGSQNRVNGFMATNNTSGCIVTVGASNCVFNNIMLANNGNATGMNLDATSNNNVISNSQILGTSGSYGVKNYGSGNRFINIKNTGNYQNWFESGTNTQYYQCDTNTKGTATIAVSGTSVTVTHGLPLTPNFVEVTPQGNIGSVWVTNITAIQFTINCSTAPAGATTVLWKAEY